MSIAIMNNLNLGKCPHDSSDLVFNNQFGLYICEHCEFNCTEEEYDMAVMQPRDEEYHIPTAEENLSALNRL